MVLLRVLTLGGVAALLYWLDCFGFAQGPYLESVAALTVGWDVAACTVTRGMACAWFVACCITCAIIADALRGNQPPWYFGGSQPPYEPSLVPLGSLCSCVCQVDFRCSILGAQTNPYQIQVVWILFSATVRLYGLGC